MTNTFLEQVQEIKKHKWIESEKAGYDVGEEWAAKDWVSKHALNYRHSRGKDGRCQVKVSVRTSVRL